MQNKIDTKGYTILGLRKAVTDIRKCVRARELYFVYFDMLSRKVTVNEPCGYSTTKILILESGVYEISQQELVDKIIDKITLK